MVFLNGCSTKGQVEGLLNVGMEKIIATDRSIDDGMATEFAMSFYQGLAGGKAVEIAFKDAKVEFEMKGKNVSINEIRINRRVSPNRQVQLDNFAWGLYQKEAERREPGLGALQAFAV